MSRTSISSGLAVPLLLALGAACTTQNEPGRDNLSQQESKLTAAAAGGSSAGAATVAVVRRTGAIVEVEVTSTTDFYVGALPPVLVIDGKAFVRSKSPPDGRLNTLIFTIDAADFDALPEGGAVSVGYLHPGARLTPGRSAGAGLTANGAPAAGSAPVVRPDQVGADRRSIGNLHKSLMEVRP